MLGGVGGVFWPEGMCNGLDQFIPLNINWLGQFILGG